MVLPLILGLTRLPFLCLFKLVSLVSPPPLLVGEEVAGKVSWLWLNRMSEFWFCSLDAGKKK